MLLLTVIIARMVVLDPVRKGIMWMSYVVPVVSVIVLPGDFVLVAHHRPVKMLERVRVPVWPRINQQQQGREHHQRGQGELTRSTLTSLIRFS